MSKRFNQLVAIVLFLAVGLIGSSPAFAGPVPSKTAVNQSLSARDAELAKVSNVVNDDQVASALAAQGFTKDQVNQRLAQLSDQDLQQLSQNLDQIQAAGMTRSEWLWIAIGAIAALIIVIAVN